MINYWESEVYSKHKQLNRYPYGELVSVFFNSLKYLKTGRLRILELGCGAGNNLWFFSELGHLVYGIDGSISAVKHSKKTLSLRGLEAEVCHGYFNKLPHDDDSMDVLIDRESLYCGLVKDIESYLLEVARVLKPGGVFITFRFSDNDPNLKLLNIGDIFGRNIEFNTWIDVDSGPFYKTGVVHFSTAAEMLSQHSFLDIKYFNEHTSKPVANQAQANKSESSYCEYILVGVNK
jgi:SAM-dependent methyltransferase